MERSGGIGEWDAHTTYLEKIILISKEGNGEAALCIGQVSDPLRQGMLL